MKRILSYAFAIAAALSIVSCTEEETPITANGIILKVDKDVIKCDGSDAATFTVVTDGGEVIKDGITFYSGMEEVAITGSKFTASTAGEYSFWASYKTFNSNSVTIKAINTTAPDVVADPKPNSTSFVRRVFLTQFTGTQCGYCPGMTNWLNILRKDLGMKDKTVLAAVHSDMNSGDPAAISAPKASADPFRHGQGIPFLSLDMCMGTSYTNNDSELHYATLLKEAVEERIQTAPATAGISVNPRYEEGVIPVQGGGNSNGIIARVQVKVSETAEYAVGAWLLEDDLYGRQSIYQQYVTVFPEYDYDTHDNCARVVDSYSNLSYVGHNLGEIQAGKTAEKTFILKVANSWDLANMHLVVFVTKKDNPEKTREWSVNNVIDCPVNKPTAFEYAN